MGVCVWVEDGVRWGNLIFTVETKAPRALVGGSGTPGEILVTSKVAYIASSH